MIIHTKETRSPIGRLALFAAGEALVAVAFEGEATSARAGLKARFQNVTFEEHPDPAGAASRLRAYFAGEMAALDGIAVETGGTPFQREVWAALRRIPAGTAISYADLAASIGRPKAVRAVGAANGANPVPIVVPCHRVIASDATLGGYGGGLDKKRWLLRHEGALVPDLLDPVAERGGAGRVSKRSGGVSVSRP